MTLINYITDFKKSLRYAKQGLNIIWREEINFRYQSSIAGLVIIAMIGFGVTKIEAVVLLLLITIVLVLEILNSVIERLVDMFKPRLHMYAESIKDLLAAMVLLGSLLALAIGVIIFWPYVFN